MSEQEEYITISKAAEEIGLKRASMYHYIKILEIETKSFRLRREKFISVRDFDRIKEVREKPWLAGERPASEDATQAVVCSAGTQHKVTANRLVPQLVS